MVNAFTAGLSVSFEVVKLLVGAKYNVSETPLLKRTFASDPCSTALVAEPVLTEVELVPFTDKLPDEPSLNPNPNTVSEPCMVTTPAP